MIMMVSMDLPYTQENWCGAAGVDRIITLSDHLSAEFGQKYGVLVKEMRVLRRAIFVVDAHDRIVYAAYMPELKNSLITRQYCRLHEQPWQGSKAPKLAAGQLPSSKEVQDGRIICKN